MRLILEVWCYRLKNDPAYIWSNILYFTYDKFQWCIPWSRIHVKLHGLVGLGQLQYMIFIVIVGRHISDDLCRGTDGGWYNVYTKRHLGKGTDHLFVYRYYDYPTPGCENQGIWAVVSKAVDTTGPNLHIGYNTLICITVARERTCSWHSCHIWRL